MNEYSLSQNDSELLSSEKELAQFFEKVAELSKNPRLAANWVMGEFLRLFNDAKIEFSQLPIQADQLAELIRLVDKKDISGKMAKEVFEAVWKTGKSPKELVKEMGLSQITDEAVLSKMIQDVLLKNPKNVDEYKAGKTKLFGFFVGQVMKLTKGQASPELVNKLIKKELDK